MKTYRYLMAIGSVLMLFMFWKYMPYSEKDNFQEAISKFERNNLEEALIRINEAIQMDSTNSEYYALRGKILYEMQDTIPSDEDFEKTLEFATTDLEKDLRIREMIEWDLKHGEHEKVRELLKKEIELYKDDSLMYVEVVEYAASVYLTIGDTHESIALYSSLSKKYPNSARFYNQLGILYSILKKDKSAIRALKNAVQVEPANDTYLYNLGIAYMNVKNIKRAKQYFKLATDLGHHEACKEYRELTANIKYYKRSRCCDGTTSTALAQGACSHHGGVCGLENVPYKEYTMDCY